MEDKGKPVPVILKKKVQETEPLQVNVRKRDTEHKVVREEQVSFDKILDDSKSEFYITGKTTKIGLMNFLNLIDKHDIGEVAGLDEEEIVLSSDLVTRIATASVIDEIQEDLKYVDSFAIGVFISACFLSIFALLTASMNDIRTFAWILLLISGLFLAHYTYRGIKSGELNRVSKIIIKSLSKR